MFVFIYLLPNEANLLLSGWIQQQEMQHEKHCAISIYISQTCHSIITEGNRIAAMYQLQFSFEMRLVPGLLWSLIPFCCSVTHPFSFIFGWAFMFNVSDTTVAGYNYVCEDASQVRRLVFDSSLCHSSHVFGQWLRSWKHFGSISFPWNSLASV